jgi:hypothetical protein
MKCWALYVNGSLITVSRRGRHFSLVVVVVVLLLLRLLRRLLLILLFLLLLLLLFFLLRWPDLRLVDGLLSVSSVFFYLPL